MLNIIIGLFIFCIVLFFYLHIQFHLKTGDDLEIYEIEQASKDKMEEICDLRQPVLFDLPSVEDSDKISNTTNKQYLLDNYPVFEIKIRDTYDTNLDSNMCVPLPLHIATKLFRHVHIHSHSGHHIGCGKNLDCDGHCAGSHTVGSACSHNE